MWLGVVGQGRRSAGDDGSEASVKVEFAPTWLSGGKAVAQSVAGAVPALVLVIFAGVLALLGLACDHDRRAYADRFVDLAAVLVGRPRGPSRGVTGAGPRQAPR